jgi:hypothetical protein
MKTVSFNILINADKQKVWNTMLDDKTYREWTKAFHEGSYYEGTWEEGSEIRFIGPAEDGKTGGMYSRIKKNVPYEFISIEHLGTINNGVIDTTSEEVKKWTPAFENYTFTEKEGQTEVKVDMEVAPEYESMFNEMWPRALQSLKTLCES